MQIEAKHQVKRDELKQFTVYIMLQIQQQKLDCANCIFITTADMQASCKDNCLAYIIMFLVMSKCEVSHT